MTEQAQPQSAAQAPDAQAQIPSQAQARSRPHPQTMPQPQSLPKDQVLAYQVAAGTPDPELPTLTIEDLGILRQVDYSPSQPPSPTTAGSATVTGGAAAGGAAAGGAAAGGAAAGGALGDGAPGQAGEVVVTITPTYSGCPAMHEIRADIRYRLARAGFARVSVRTRLSPPWTTDWITEAGRKKLADSGIAPPPEALRRTGAARRAGPVPLFLSATASPLFPSSSPSSSPLSSPPSRPASPPSCPRCGSADTVRTAGFSGTACKSLHRCRACDEPFEAVKPL